MDCHALALRPGRGSIRSDPVHAGRVSLGDQGVFVGMATVTPGNSNAYRSCIATGRVGSCRDRGMGICVYRCDTRSVQQLLSTVWPRNARNGPVKRRQGTSCISDAWGVRTEPRRRSVGQEPSAYMIWD